MLLGALRNKNNTTFVSGVLSKLYPICRTQKSNLSSPTRLGLLKKVTTSSFNPQEIMEIDPKLKKRHTVEIDPPVVILDCDEAFNGLSPKEKLYAHYLSQACWVGGLIITAQTSPESPAIYSLIHDAFKSNGIEGLKSMALDSCDFTEEDWKAFLSYSCGILYGFGNYKGYGDSKIIPSVSSSKMQQLLSQAKLNGLKSLNLDIGSRWGEISHRMYSLEENVCYLGLGNKGVTTYFSSNCTSEDADLIGRFLKDQKLEPWNTRAFKTVEKGIKTYEIRSASANHNDGSEKTHDFEGCKFVLTRGDYSPLMKSSSHYLAKAKEYASNNLEKEMLEFYIKSFSDGSVDDHKDGSRRWVKNQGPTIETYIGFIENYRDPVQARSEFEGFVSVVNRPMSEKYQALVANAEKILVLLPWPSEFERTTFTKPDFTSLDVLTFASGGIPSGINIPNYDEIRQKEGFKNVTLGNVIPASLKNIELPFFSTADQNLMQTFFVKSYEFQTGLHELLGHGSGLNFVMNEDGTTNFPSDLRNPLTNELVEGMYHPGETYNSVFSDFSSPYEECRAETIGLLLSLDKGVQRIFGFEDEEGTHARNANWLTAVYDGIRSLDMYQPGTKSWMQAHSQAAFVTMQVLIEAGEELIDIKETVGSDGKPTLLAYLDFQKLETVAKKAVSDFILKLQVYKSTADHKSAREMFEGYSIVNDEGKYPWASWRDIILDRKPPKKFFVQPNTILVEDGKSVVLKPYDSSPTGLVQSVIDRLQEVDIYSGLEYCYQKDKPYFPRND